MLIKLRKAQNTAEYAIVLGLVVGAVVAMQVYVKRGLQGRYAQAVSAQNTSDPDDPYQSWGKVDYSKQYEPYYLRSGFVVARNSTGYGDMDVDGVDYSKRGTADNINRSSGGFQAYDYSGGHILGETEEHTVEEHTVEE